MAHVFQIMAGTSRHGALLSRVPSSVGLPGTFQDDKRELDPFDSPLFFGIDAFSRAMCTCPVCSSKSLMTLSELGSIPVPGPEDDEIIPDIRIGATGIVLPDHRQLARWFKVPIPPKFKRSRLHLKAKREGKQHGTFTFFSTFSFESVFFTPNLFTMGVACLASLVAGLRSWSSVKKLACEEDKGIALELTVRKHAFRARNGAWEKLYYCSGCGMVHDREGKRSLPWYSMLQLVHYPEQEFQTMDAPELPDVNLGVRSHSESAQHAA